MSAYLQRLVDWYTRLAITPGCWGYTRARVRELEADPSRLHKGLHEAVAAHVKALDYRPAPFELGDWWLCPSQAELAARHHAQQVHGRAARKSEGLH